MPQPGIELTAELHLFERPTCRLSSTAAAILHNIFYKQGPLRVFVSQRSHPMTTMPMTCLTDFEAIFSVLAGSILSKVMSSVIRFISWVNFAILVGLFTEYCFKCPAL